MGEEEEKDEKEKQQIAQLKSVTLGKQINRKRKGRKDDGGGDGDDDGDHVLQASAFQPCPHLTEGAWKATMGRKQKGRKKGKRQALSHGSAAWPGAVITPGRALLAHHATFHRVHSRLAPMERPLLFPSAPTLAHRANPPDKEALDGETRTEAPAALTLKDREKNAVEKKSGPISFNVQ